MYVNRIELSFDAGHRLLDYPGKCAAPHGHTYRAEVFVAARELDALGLALDFAALKRRMKAWVDEYWDHAFLLNDRDTALVGALGALPESKLYLFRGVNPSAEAMAQQLFEVARRQFGDLVRSVRIWESPGQYAEFVPDGTLLPCALQEEALP
ncbi:MAG: 6-carboxytetrahydropterin synthase [Chloroflexi bacterium]|nr:6-carboxytetrahydropterin synthase [Chloroflexota bacterium]